MVLTDSTVDRESTVNNPFLNGTEKESFSIFERDRGSTLLVLCCCDGDTNGLSPTFNNSITFDQFVSSFLQILYSTMS